MATQDRWVIIGDPGEGKTLLANHYLYKAFLSGYNVYANIELDYPFTYIEDTSYIDGINVNEKNAVLYDEVGEMQSGVHKFSFNSAISQSRKTLGEGQLFIMTTQTKYQTNPTLLSIVSHIIYPEILSIDKSKDNCPVQVKAYFHEKIKHSSPPSFKQRPESIICNVSESIKHYNTFETVKPIQDGSYKEYIKKYKQYIGIKGKLSDLTTLISTMEGKSIAESNRLARMVINAKEMGLLLKMKMEEDYNKYKDTGIKKKP